MGQTKSTSSSGGNRKCNQEQSKNQPLDCRADKNKDKVSYPLKDTYIYFLMSSHQNLAECSDAHLQS